MHVTCKGGYDVPLAGRPESRTETLAEPDVLFLPLLSRRFAFTESAVRDGQTVRAGDVLARDPERHGVPLLAPRGGTVRPEAVEGHVVLEDLTADGADEARTDESDPRRKLVDLGAWRSVEDAHTGKVPDPSVPPAAVIVSTVRLEPFGSRGDVQLRSELEAFSRGLERVQGLLEYQPIHFVMPEIQSAFAREVRENLRGHAFLQIATIPLRYPMDDFALIARGLGLEAHKGPVWAMRTDGVLAIDRALTGSRPTLESLATTGGPAAREPRHLHLPTGYPLDALRSAEFADGARIVLGGAMTGERVDPNLKGVPLECPGLTGFEPMRERQLLGWIRPGWSRRSYSRTFLSSLRGQFAERIPSALRGERRACVACGHCEEVCPARIMPHMIHKYLYQGSLDDAERLGVDLCVGCGLCSYVCPSKIELREQLLDAQRELAEERAHAAEVAAEAEAAAAGGSEEGTAS